MKENLKEKLLEKANSIYQSKAFPVVCAVGASAGTVMPVFAAGATTVVSRALGTVVAIMQYIGVILAVWALGQLFLAFKNEDADSKSRAIMTVMAAMALMAIKPVTNGILTAAGIDGISVGKAFWDNT